MRALHVSKASLSTQHLDFKDCLAIKVGWRQPAVDPEAPVATVTRTGKLMLPS